MRLTGSQLWSYYCWLPVHSSSCTVPIHSSLPHQLAVHLNCPFSFGLCTQHSVWHPATWQEICYPHSTQACSQTGPKQTQLMDWTSQWTLAVHGMECGPQAVGNGSLCQSAVAVAYVLLPGCCSATNTMQIALVCGYLRSPQMMR